MSHHEHKNEAPRIVGCAVITISDSRTEETDESGKLLKQRIIEGGHKLLDYALLKNDAGAIKQKISELLKLEEMQVIITSGRHRSRDGL